MRPPGFSQGIILIPRIEPGSLGWQPSILTTILRALFDIKNGLKN